MKTLRIKDICDKGSSSLKQKDVENQNGVYPVFGASGLIGKIDTYHQNKDYIAIVKDGSGIGRVTFMPAFSSVIGTLQYILPKEGFNIKYISYCLQSLDLAHYKQGAAIPHIYFRDYGEYEVNVEENPDDQQRIVTYLDAEFAKIEALKANAEKQLQAAKDLFQSALKELLTPKEGWVEKKLGEVCNKITDGTHNSPINTETGDFMYVTAKNIKPTGIDLSNITYVTKEIHKEIYERCNPEFGDVLYIKDGATTGIAVINTIKEKFSLLSSVALLKSKEQILLPIFLCYVMNSPMMYNYVRSKMEGAAITRVTLTKIKNFPITLPPLSEQQRIADRLDALSANVKALQTNYTETITLCNDLKQALLKKVFEEDG